MSLRKSEVKPIYIIIPTYNNLDYLIPCIESIAANTVFYFKFIIVNNGANELDKYITINGSKIIHTNRNLGWAGGINEGLKAIDEPCDYVIFMNDDTAILPNHYDWMHKLSSILDNDPEVAAVGPSSNVVMGLQSMGYRLLPAILSVKYLIGFCVMVRKDLFLDIGGMDESLPGGDDFDWSIRFREAGYKLVARRDTFVFHHGFVTGQKVFGDYWNSPKYCDEVNISLIRKHGLKTFVDTIRGVHNIISYDLIGEEYGENNCLMPIVNGKGIDVGCGTAKISEDTIGVDLIHRGSLVGQFGGEGSGISKADIMASGDNLYMFGDDSLDYVVARHNIEHYTNPIKTLREWNRILKMDGKLGITTPDGNKLNSIRLDKTHKHSFDREGLKDLLELTGFKIDEMGGTANQWDFYVIASKDNNASISNA